MTIHTEICDLIGIKHPIIQAGMGPFTTVNLATAVSKEGALGVVSQCGGPHYDKYRGITHQEVMIAAIEEVNKKTNDIFGINVRVPKTSDVAKDVIDYVVDRVKSDSNFAKKLRVVITSAGDPLQEYLKEIKKAGMIHIHVAAAVKHAQRVEKAGCDAVIASGYEAGGHLAHNPVHTFVLIPEVIKSVKIPVVAAGGICDGKNLAAVLIMGGAGVQMGTRFIATQESDFKNNYKETFLEGTETDTIVLEGFLSPHCRYLSNPWTDNFQEMIAAGATEEERTQFKIQGRLQAAEVGDKDKGSMLCGMVVGRIHDLPTVSEVINRTINEAEELLSSIPKKVLKSS
ncbi:MAG: nitronate monooxygenase [Candidatus Helarchaeota archaeon]|nr:nitronate monooxygenase [Candidatus Helarchaeota archaeon]